MSRREPRDFTAERRLIPLARAIPIGALGAVVAVLAGFVAAGAHEVGATAARQHPTGTVNRFEPERPDTVVVESGGLRLHAVYYRPHQRGPFPGVLFLHGSGHKSGVDAQGMHDHRHPEILGPVFARHGYAFLYLYRRGDGLSRSEGTPAADQLDRAMHEGQEARNRVQVRLLEGDELQDALSGLAYLRARSDVDSQRLAVVGHSFGGSLALIVAEHDRALRAVVSFSGAGLSWGHSPELRALLTQAVDRARPPIFLIDAANDFSTVGPTALAAELSRLSKPHELRIYPSVGTTPQEGHDFIHTQVPVWEHDVFAFLDSRIQKLPAK
jgi:dienelactone hydrolase